MERHNAGGNHEKRNLSLLPFALSSLGAMLFALRFAVEVTP
jgi:hypothetical protein